MVKAADPRSDINFPIREFNSIFELFTNNNHKDKFDPYLDYDFSTIKSDGEDFTRGNLTYKRPLGSKRYGLKVREIYGNDDWLGWAGYDWSQRVTHRVTNSTKGEWPVAYYGTSQQLAVEIVLNGGFNFLEGRLCCTPDPTVALADSESFSHDGKTYKLILQCRIDPEHMRVTRSEGIPGHIEYCVDSDEDAIRPYGICVYSL